MSLRKQIRKILREAVGVPEGIHDSAVKLVKELSVNVDNFEQISEDMYKLELIFEDPLKIGQMELENMDIVIELHKQSFDLDKVVLMGLAVPQQHTGKPEIQKKRPTVKLELDKDNLFILFNFAIDDNLDFSDIENWFKDKSNTDDITSIISHELKHIYDTFVKPRESVKSRVNYSIQSRIIQGGIPLCMDLKEMFFLMYFVDNIENLVRPTEIYSHMMTKGITKEGFLKELKSTETYRHLHSAMFFSKQNLKNDLLDDMECVDGILNSIPNKEVSDLTDEQKVDVFMEVIPMVYGNMGAHTFVEYIQSFEKQEHPLMSELRQLLGMDTEEDKDMDLKQKRLEEFMGQIHYFVKNPDKFYDFYQKRLNFKGRQVFKKISKVYSLLPSEKEENKIHSKINKRDMKESDYINFEFYKEKNKREMEEKDYSIIKRHLDEYKKTYGKKNPPQK
jgi:hypothetical protein